MPLTVTINRTPIVYPDYSSIEFSVACRKAQGGITEINYSDSNELGEANGNQRQILGTTPGIYKAEGSFSMQLKDGQDIIDALSPGFYDKIFDIVVVYQIPQTSSFITDTLAKCRLKKQDHAHKSGNDALMKKFDLHITYILWNGKNPILNMRR